MTAPPSVFVLVPGRLNTRTGGYIYDQRMVDGLRQRGWTVEVRELDPSLPFPTPAALEEAAQVFAEIPSGAVALVDGLALGAMPDVAEHESSRLRIAALVHLPLAAEVGLDRKTAACLEASERRALAAARLVIVTGAAAFDLLDKYSVGRDKIVVVEPGTDRTPSRRPPLAPHDASAPERSIHNATALHLLCVATLNPGKGHEILLRALAAIPLHNWRLTCVGSLIRHPQTADRVRAAIRDLRLDARVSLVGEVDPSQLADYYQSADVFVLATLQETYGMAVAEALMHGLPVVSTMTGAIGRLVGTEAGLVVPPGHVEALSQSLSRVLGDAALRTRLAEGAGAARHRLPTWEDSVSNMAAALEGISE